jgi:hypothetical protein
MTEFLHHIVANREYIQRDMAILNGWANTTYTDPWADAQTVVYPRYTDPWADAQDVVQPSSDDSEQRY